MWNWRWSAAGAVLLAAGPENAVRASSRVMVAVRKRNVTGVPSGGLSGWGIGGIFGMVAGLIATQSPLELKGGGPSQGLAGAGHRCGFASRAGPRRPASRALARAFHDFSGLFIVIQRCSWFFILPFRDGRSTYLTSALRA